MTPDGLIASLTGPFVGRVNDAKMVRESGLQDRLREIFRNRPVEERFWLYGDKAYVGKYGIMGAYKTRRRQRALGRDEQAYNALIASMRIVVENGFTHVANLFMAVGFKAQCKISKYNVDLNCIIDNDRSLPRSRILRRRRRPLQSSKLSRSEPNVAAVRLRASYDGGVSYWFG